MPSWIVCNIPRSYPFLSIFGERDSLVVFHRPVPVRSLCCNSFRVSFSQATGGQSWFCGYMTLKGAKHCVCVCVCV